MARELGRRPPTDDVHIQKYPLTAATRPDGGGPLGLGTNWYAAFDDPIYDDKSNRWWICANPYNLGSIRGGHMTMLPQYPVDDPMGWWHFYNQGQEGACVGFAASRMMSHLNRARYDARWLYREAQKIDEWPGENYDGTSLRAAFDILRDKGHVKVIRGKPTLTHSADQGIWANRWLTSIEDVITMLGDRTKLLKIGGVPMLNSWGRDGVRVDTRWDGSGYPHIVWIPFEVLDRLMREDGEVVAVTDK